MTHLTHDSAGLLDTLQRFETSLETPVVPGELAAWCQAALGHCQQVGQQLQHQVQQVHPPLLEQIQDQDPGLATRVDELRHADQELLAAFPAVLNALERLCEAAENLEPDEARLQHPLDEIMDESLAFVISARKQETAITTWYLEAFDRDRGDVD